MRGDAARRVRLTKSEAMKQWRLTAKDLEVGAVRCWVLLVVGAGC